MVGGSIPSAGTRKRGSLRVVRLKKRHWKDTKDFAETELPGGGRITVKRLFEKEDIFEWEMHAWFDDRGWVWCRGAVIGMGAAKHQSVDTFKKILSSDEHLHYPPTLFSPKSKALLDKALRAKRKDSSKNERNVFPFKHRSAQASKARR